jgi:hypothetical protein
MDIANDPLADPLKIVPPHIKLGLIQIFVKAITQNGESF